MELLSLLLFLAIPAAIVAAGLFVAKKSLDASPRARRPLAAFLAASLLAFGALMARQSLGSHTGRGTMEMTLFCGAAGLASLVLVAKRSTIPIGKLGILAIVWSVCGFWLGSILFPLFSCTYCLDHRALGDVRAILSSQQAYAGSNDGAYGRLSCLAAPVTCGFAADTSPFLDTQLAGLAPVSGYQRSFIPGPAKIGQPDSLGFSQFAYVAIPLHPGQSGLRAFCGDDTGRICMTEEKMPIVLRLRGIATIPVKNGRCPDDCVELR